MSRDAQYILDYYSNGYIEPTPMQLDKKYLEQEYGGEVYFISSSVAYWDKPKYRLSDGDYKKLRADRVLEKCDCDLFEARK